MRDLFKHVLTWSIIHYQCARPAPKCIVWHQKLIKISRRPSYVDVLLTVLVTFEAGGGGSRRGKIKIVDIWKIEIYENYYQLIIASTSTDVSGDMSADFYGSSWYKIRRSSNINWLILEVACKCQIGFLSEIRLSSIEEFIYLSDQIWLLWLEDDLIF